MNWLNKIRLYGMIRIASVVGAFVLLGIGVQPTPNPVLAHAQKRADPEVSQARASLRTTGTTVVPSMADEFADSFGVNTRFGSGIYATQRPTVENFLVQLGFRHIRDGNTTYKAETREFLQKLCVDHGIHSGLGLSDTDSDAAILQYVHDVPCLDMVEGPNEINGQANWLERLSTFIPHAYKLVRSSHAFDGIPFVAPSITRLEDSELLAQSIDLSKSVDYGNKHSYPGQRNIGGDDATGARGWGPTHSACPSYGYGSFFFAVCSAQVFTKDRPIWTTETGYASTPDGLAPPPKSGIWGSIPYDVATKYFPRLMAYEFLNGVSRTYIMALLDGASGCHGPFNSLGLVEQDCPNTGSATSLHIKPPFYALKNLMATVSDPGPAFTPTPVMMKISGGDARLHTLLLQKRNGEDLLLYWLEASDWKVLEGTYVSVAPEPITLSIAGMGTRNDAKTFGFDKNGGLTGRQNLRFANDAVRLTATDSVQFLTFAHPARG